MRPQGQMERSLVNLTIGMRNGERDRADALLSTRAGPFAQRVQFPISGIAIDAWGFQDTPVTWEHPFVYSPMQWNVPFQTPHVSDHIEFTGVLSELVLARAHVISWLQTPQGWFIGATVRVAVTAPGTASDTPTAFKGVVHLTFDGFAYPTDEELST